MQGLTGTGVLRDGFGIERGCVNVEAFAWLPDFDNYQPDAQRKGGDKLEIQQSFQANPPQFLHIADAGNAHHHSEEDHRHNHHADELDEAIAQWFHGFARRRVEGAQ